MKGCNCYLHCRTILTFACGGFRDTKYNSVKITRGANDCHYHFKLWKDKEILSSGKMTRHYDSIVRICTANQLWNFVSILSLLICHSYKARDFLSGSYGFGHCQLLFFYILPVLCFLVFITISFIFLCIISLLICSVNIFLHNVSKVHWFIYYYWLQIMYLHKCYFITERSASVLMVKM